MQAQLPQHPLPLSFFVYGDTSNTLNCGGVAMRDNKQERQNGGNVHELPTRAHIRSYMHVGIPQTRWSHALVIALETEKHSPLALSMRDCGFEIEEASFKGGNSARKIFKLRETSN